VACRKAVWYGQDRIPQISGNAPTVFDSHRYRCRTEIEKKVKVAGGIEKEWQNEGQGMQ
jgi:hypothetical protein